MEEAKGEIEELKEGIKELKEVISSMEKARAEEMTGGKSEAGITPQPADPEVEMKKATKKYFKGTVIDSMIK